VVASGPRRPGPRAAARENWAPVGGARGVRERQSPI
jgi:hypothetical protein